ncbi:hypothetical protein MTR67_035079 [Solanum verrucosum]|uniref:DUF7746 domain-containing protein n=1 Tax=Solanum verrucosum TaxID=315347 RepID=A0AAF0U9I6_SOLVR|nr:hypothetical protein MTR67_035079 [Solanum verrucosum]
MIVADFTGQLRGWWDNYLNMEEKASIINAVATDDGVDNLGPRRCSIESTVAYGPVYFNTQPNLRLSLTDANILDALTLNVKTHGYNYAPGSELITLSYRIYFKLLSTLNPRCRLYDISDQTILVETNFARSKVTTRRPIKWEEIDFPASWTLNSALSPNQLRI